MNHLTRKYKVLIADDHTLTRRGLALIVNQHPNLHLAGEASSGLECINLFYQLEPDLLIVDITMPHLNGIEVSRKVMKAKPDTRIILITMNDPDEFLLPALRSGVHSFLRKDISVEEYLLAIDTVLMGNTYFSQDISEVVIKAYIDKRIRIEKADQDFLTFREKQVLTLIAEGYTTREIAEKANLSSKTVDTHRSNIYKKLGVHNNAGLIKFAYENKLVTTKPKNEGGNQSSSNET